ncbi:hypothetical protein MNBD_NITROSPIRAE01-1988 [hydrothermal vent metagenome]|uniref:Sirohydrochlorin cobaltochelatase n=1 Tax=hydrothermal vent metagenome TaxID=652676 RepID=A0A3B1DA08_9ZZZZ
MTADKNALQNKDMTNALKSSNIIIVLAMHGTPPKDFPKTEHKELFEIRAALKHATNPSKALKARHDFLDKKMRLWPRTEKNDPFHFGSMALGHQLEKQSRFKVIVGFNEFCDPDLDKAIREAVGLADKKVLVTTPMMTRGGSHSKGDIPSAIAGVKKDFPKTDIIYAWPFPTSEIAGFLSAQIQVFL